MSVQQQQQQKFAINNHSKIIERIITDLEGS
jgi:hypothetical protein